MKSCHMACMYKKLSQKKKLKEEEPSKDDADIHVGADRPRPAREHLAAFNCRPVHTLMSNVV